MKFVDFTPNSYAAFLGKEGGGRFDPPEPLCQIACSKDIDIRIAPKQENKALESCFRIQKYTSVVFQTVF